MPRSSCAKTEAPLRSPEAKHIAWLLLGTAILLSAGCRSAITTPQPAVDFRTDCAHLVLSGPLQLRLVERGLVLRCSPELLNAASSGNPDQGGSGSPSIASAVTRAMQAEDEVRVLLGFAPAQERQPIELMLYASARDYRVRTAAQGRIAASQAYYDTLRRQMHVPIRSPLSHWRHEWSHAHVADVFPGTPYWIHEALATLIEETNDWNELRLPRRMQALAPAAQAAVRTHTGSAPRRTPNTNPLLSAGSLPQTLLARPPTAATAVLATFYLAELLSEQHLPQPTAFSTQPTQAPDPAADFWIGLAGVDRALRISVHAQRRAARPEVL